VVIYGRQALTLKHSDGRRNIPSLKNTSPFSRKDCPLQTTPGLIAFAAVVVGFHFVSLSFWFLTSAFCEARFILSDDESWPSTGVGPKSSIDYGDAFNTYKRFIIIGRHKEESRHSIALLFQRWDDQVFPKKAGSDLGTNQPDDVEVVEERRNAEFTDFFNRMQLEDDDNAPQLSNNSESMYMAEEMQAHPQSGSSGVQDIASGAAAPTVTIPAASTIPAAVDRSLQAVAAPSKSKARPKPKPKKVPASKKAQNMLETPQVGFDGMAAVDGGFVVIDEVDAAGGQPAQKATRSRKGKAKAVI
jgi:hypothetical protein